MTAITGLLGLNNVKEVQIISDDSLAIGECVVRVFGDGWLPVEPWYEQMWVRIHMHPEMYLNHLPVVCKDRGMVAPSEPDGDELFWGFRESQVC